MGNGGPIRIRLPRQLGYKSVKFLNRLIVTDDVKKFGKGLGSVSPEQGYACIRISGKESPTFNLGALAANAFP